MLITEANWFARQIDRLDLPANPLVLNLGSQTEEFVRDSQPWLETVFLASLRRRGARIVNVDLQQAPGVDLVGNLMDPAFQGRLASMRPAVFVVCNVLEHVADPRLLAAAIAAVFGPGTLLLVSCPREYPYHPDPIDNGLRPSVAELAGLFPGLEIVAGEVVPDHPYLSYLRRQPGLWLRKLARLLLPFINFAGWKQTLTFLPWWFRRFSATCLILRQRS
jgi:SAM-dependent methyltransferase